MPDKALLVFARAPQAGTAKTRLIPALGAEGAAALHAGLVERTLQTACDGDADVQLWCHPDPQHAFFRYCVDRFPVGLHGQAGDDLGGRMAHALSLALSRHDHAVLIGTDCPALTASDLEAAFSALAGGTDVVLGPAADGGYYLVGLRRACDDIFVDIDWGSAQVLSQTKARLRQSGLNYHLLETRRDLDTPRDLDGSDDQEAIMQRGKELVELDR